MRLLMLGWGLDSGVDRSKMRHFLPEYFHMATPRGLMKMDLHWKHEMDCVSIMRISMSRTDQLRHWPERERTAEAFVAKAL